MKWEIKFKPGWDKYFKKFDKETQHKIIKKIDQMENNPHARGLHSTKYQVEEVGQYRIAFIQKENTKYIHFIGNHKQYKKWYKII